MGIITFWKRLFRSQSPTASPPKATSAAEQRQSAVKPPVPSMTLTLEDRRFDAVGTPDQLASAVTSRARVFFRVEYNRFGQTWETILRALPSDTNLQQSFNFEIHLRLACANCQAVLTPLGLGTLIMSQSGGLVNPRSPSAACRRCGGSHAYLIFDPDGFRPPSGPIANYFVYASAESARAAFAVAKQHLGGRPPTLRGRLELRTNTVGIAGGIPYPYWVVLHFQDIQESTFNAFMESFAAVRETMHYNDWEITKSTDKIAANASNSTLVDSLSF